MLEIEATRGRHLTFMRRANTKRKIHQRHRHYSRLYFEIRTPGKNNSFPAKSGKNGKIYIQKINKGPTRSEWESQFCVIVSGSRFSR